MTDHPELIKKLRKPATYLAVKYRDHAADAIEALTKDRDALAKDAAFGRVALRFVDRAGDVDPDIDSADTICADFYKAMCIALGESAKQLTKGKP